jgi:hypothetical protein
MSYGNAIAICYYLQFYTMIPYITVDNFFESPDLVRYFALNQDYFKGDRGNWPGIRSHYLDGTNNELFHLTAKKLMSVMPRQYTSFTNLEVTFQIIDKSWGSGWVHDDDGDRFNMAGMIYLTPDPPVDSGTSFFDFRMDESDKKYQTAFHEEMNVPDKRNAHPELRAEHRNQWTPNIVVQNRYNRCNIFSSLCWHSADHFFGESKDDSRLTMVFFGHAI